MKNVSGVSTWIVSRMIVAASVVGLAACSGTQTADNGYMSTPTVDYIESLDVYSAPHKDSFLNQLAMNYRSYAIYNARTSGYADMGELFAQKAVAAFSGEVPFPESLNNWPIADDQTAFEINNAYNELMEQLKNDASDVNPELAAEAQAKFDCWLSATASGQTATARQCRDRFYKTMTALRDCTGGKIVNKQATQSRAVIQETETITTTTSTKPRANGQAYYPDARNMSSLANSARPREGVIIVNNVNVPEHLINPVPVQPMVFNQNIYGGDKTMTNSHNDSSNREYTRVSSKAPCAENNNAVWIAQDASAQEVSGCQDNIAEPQNIVPENQNMMFETQTVQQIPMVSEELVTREEFVNMMMAMRAELKAINARLDKIQAAQNDKTMIKVQQIPLEPQQHIMEEVFEIHFDFNKATIKPEYQALIQKLATATQANRNIKVSVVGHTDTSGSKDYNYSLGGRRAEAVQNMLIKYGIPASQIVAVSAGEEDLAVPTPDGVPNAENRRVRVVKEVYSEERQNAAAPVAIEVTEYSAESCGEYGCN